MFELVLYEEDDESPVLDFIDSLDNRDKAKVYVIFRLLEQQGFLPFPYSSDIKGYKKLRELRIQSRGKRIRVLHFFYADKKIILLHGFVKKDEKQVDRENETGYSRLLKYLEREKKNAKKK